MFYVWTKAVYRSSVFAWLYCVGIAHAGVCMSFHTCVSVPITRYSGLHVRTHVCLCVWTSHIGEFDDTVCVCCDVYVCMCMCDVYVHMYVCVCDVYVCMCV